MYKRQLHARAVACCDRADGIALFHDVHVGAGFGGGRRGCCLLYTSDAADERSSVDLGGRRIIKKKKQ